MKKQTYLILLLIFVFPYSTFSQVKLKVGDKAPEFSINDPKGKELNLEDLRGKIVLLDFWASWCMPCRMANPNLVNIYSQFQKNGFEIFSVSLDGKKEAWEKAILNDNLKWPYHGSDLKGWENAIAELYGVSSIPATFLLDENGIIVGKDLDEFDLQKKLNYLYYEQPVMYPTTVNSKLYFTNKTKYSIADSTGKVILKNKGEEVDLTGLPEGNYICKYENKTEKFTKKSSAESSKVTFYPVNVESEITLSRETEYEVIDQRGKLKKKGSGATIDMTDLSSGVYYLNLEGDIYKLFKK